MPIVQRENSSNLCIIAFWVFFLFLFFSLAAKIAMAADSETKEYIVFTEKPKDGQDLRDYVIQILTSVLGSKKAAEDALGYIYIHVGPGFSASLTPEQAQRLKNEPGVLQVKESKVYKLDPGRGGGVAW